MDDRTDIELLEDGNESDIIVKAGLAGIGGINKKLDQSPPLQANKGTCYATDTYQSQEDLPTTDSVGLQSHALPSNAMSTGNSLPFQMPAFHLPQLPTMPRMPYTLASAYWPSQPLFQPFYLAVPAAQSPTEHCGVKKKPAVSKFTEVVADVNLAKRMVFDRSQLSVLETVFRDNMYPTSKKKEQLAEALGTPYGKIVTWFQNRRAKNRRVQKDKELTSLKTLKQLVDKAKKFQDDSNILNDVSAIIGTSPASVAGSTSAIHAFAEQARSPKALANSRKLRSIFVRRRAEQELLTCGTDYSSVSKLSTCHMQDRASLIKHDFLAEGEKVSRPHNYGFGGMHVVGQHQLKYGKGKCGKSVQDNSGDLEQLTKEQQDILVQQMAALESYRKLTASNALDLRIVDSSRNEDFANASASLTAEKEYHAPQDLKPVQAPAEEEQASVNYTGLHCEV